MKIKTTCDNCGKDIYLEKKDIKILVHTKKGETVSEMSPNDKEYRNVPIKKSLLNTKKTHERRFLYNMYKVLEDFKAKGFICISCNHKSFIDSIYDGDIIETGKVKFSGLESGDWYHVYPCKCNKCKMGWWY